METNIRKWLAEMCERFRETPTCAPLYVVFTWYLAIWFGITSRFPLGTNVYERDWDVLIVLDACRVDTLREVADEYEFIESVDETKIEIDGTEHYVWAAVDCDTPEVLTVEVSPGRSSLDALLFLKEVLERCRGCPLVRAARSPWYDWPLKLLDCECERETWGSRLFIEAWFGIFKYRTRRIYHRFPYQSTASSTRSWLTVFAALRNATL